MAAARIDRPAAKRRPTVLVLVACYNGSRWISSQLKSILAQSGVDLRVAVRDDGSSDTTVDEIEKFNDDGRLQLSPDSLRKGSAAQNFLTLIRDNPADGFEFIAFADQDDVWCLRKLARACSMLIESLCAVGYSSSTLATWPNGRTALLTQSPRVTSTDFLFEGAGQGCTYVLRSDFYAEMRAFAISHPALTEPVHYHDWMVYALARSWGKAWLFDSSPSMRYRQHDRNDTGARRTWAGLARRINQIRRGWYRSQLLAIAAICAAAAPNDPAIQKWTKLLFADNDQRRRLRIALFCLRGARRRRLDNLIMAAAALTGWL